MSCILIILLIIQGLDYIFGFGVNNYLFVLFCIVFAFTMGGIYHNILQEKQKKSMEEYKQDFVVLLNRIDDEGLNEDLSEELAQKITELNIKESRKNGD